MAICLLLPGQARANDDIQAVGALWSDFVAALRRGDYRAAHGLFSPESRVAMPYAEFVREYGPLSAAREMVLARPESQSTRLDRDWAEIGYAGTNPGTGRQFRVGVSAVKNEGAWGLVAARNEPAERMEAAARALLSQAAAWRGNPGARRWLAETAAGAEANPLFRNYQFETDGEDFRALPRSAGLRAFHLDGWGMVRPGTMAAAPAPALVDPFPPGPPPNRVPLPELGQLPDPVPPPPAQPARPTVNGLPELSEPPPLPPLPEMPGELSEPPPAIAAPSRQERVIREPEMVRLPDQIR